MTEPMKPQPVAWDRDVLALVPLPDELLHLEGVWRLDADSSPLERLRLWKPSDPVDQDNRRFLLDFGARVLAAERTVLRELAFRDEVTGLYNRRFFSLRLEEEVSRHRKSNRPISLVLAELDGADAFTVELGRAAWDETLRGMAEVLLRNTSAVNAVCRYDGGLFAVLLADTSQAGARLYADHIRYVLSSFQFTHGRRVTASFGTASLPGVVTPTAEALTRTADESLGAAKRAGRTGGGARDARMPKPR